LKRSAPFEFWQSVTGSLNPGETSLDAARRELHEETGFVDEGILIDRNLSRTFAIDPRWRSRYADGVSENIEYEWHYRLTETSDIQLDRTEHSAFRWVTIDEAIDATWSWTNREALLALKDELRHAIQTV